ILEGGLVFEQVSLRLAQLHLIGTWINHRQQVTLLDLLAFLKSDLHKLSVDAAFDGDGIEGFNGSQPRKHNRQVTALRFGDGHGNYLSLLPPAAASARCLRRFRCTARAANQKGNKTGSKTN